MNWQKRLKEAMRLRKVTGKELADAVGIKPSSVSDWLRGRTKDMKGQYVPLVCSYLKISSTWLFKGEGEMDDTDQPVPAHLDKPNYPRVVGTARMGDLGFYYDLDGGDGIIEHNSPPGSIAIKVKGDSMHPAIRDGWFVIIEPHETLHPGEYVLVATRNEKKMVKELLYEKDDSFVLLSVNGNERMTIPKVDLIYIRPIAAVVPPSKKVEI